ncbi:MAG: SMP-30/gluconolactonase/LRE family protein [Betaproteobacteria bacterium]|nr:SMP-30/gluconolactonase/LRE family protein [Betaproteobacteria bacterium]
MIILGPVPVAETEVVASLPAQFRAKQVRNAWTDANNRGKPLDCFLEGPSFDRAGNLYFVDIPYGRIFRMSPQGAIDLVAEYDGEPNGLKIHKDGRIFIADYKQGILLLDPASGRVTPFLDRRHTERFKGPNDLVFASNGDLYFTDQGQTGLHDPTGRVYRYTAAGRLECLIDTVPSPNGLVLNPEEDVLYIAVTRGNCVWRMPLMADGSASKVGLFVQLSGASGPDGMAMDEAGNLSIVHARTGTVWLVSEKGEPVCRVVSRHGDSVTNLAYGGPDRRTLYITESRKGLILAARMPVAGRAMYSHM